MSPISEQNPPPQPGWFIGLLWSIVCVILSGFPAAAWVFPQSASAAPPIAVPGVLSLRRGVTHDATDGEQIFATTGEPGGLYRSADGTDWVQLTPTLPNIIFTTVTTTPNGTIYGMSTDGLFRSTDDGRTWNAVLTDVPIFFVTHLANGSLLARTWKRGLLRSETNGASWDPVGSELSEHPVLSLLQDANNVVWAATFGGGVYQSTDNGMSWTRHGLNQGYVITLALDTKGILYAGTYHQGVYRLDPFGWTPLNKGLPEQAAVQVLAATSAGLVASIAHHGLYRTTTGGGWVPVAGEPDQIKEITGILPTKEGQWLVSTRPHGLFQVDPATHLWTPMPLHVGVPTVAADLCGGIYTTLPDGLLFHSTPANAKPSRRCQYSGMSGYLGRTPRRNNLLFITHSDQILIGGEQGLSIFHPPEKEGLAAEKSWRGVALPRTNTQVTCLTETSTALIAGTRYSLLRSTNDGASWESLTDGEAVRACVALGEDLYLTTSTGLSFSHDGGVTWTHYPLALAPTIVAANGDSGVILALNGASSPKGYPPTNRASLMGSTRGSPPAPLELDESGGTLEMVRALALSGNILYVASTHGVDLFQQTGTFWRWKGQVLSELVVAQITPLLNDRVAVAGDRGLFVLHGADDVIQVAVTRGSY